MGNPADIWGQLLQLIVLLADILSSGLPFQCQALEVTHP